MILDTASSVHGSDVRISLRKQTQLLVALTTVFYLLGFMHLRADFPNRSPWNDWSKMTDEGWYGAQQYIISFGDNGICRTRSIQP